MSPCIEQKTKKYKSRTSPPYSAMDCKGSTKKGNDGAIYVSKPDKRGIYRWVKSNSNSPKKLQKNKTVKLSVKEYKSSPVYTSKSIYKKTDYGPINVSKFIKCIHNNTVKESVQSRIQPKNIYEINDNASFPFVLFDYGNGQAEIYNNHFIEETNNTALKDKLMDVKYKQIFLGDNESNDPYWRFKRGVAKGNTILLQTDDNQYLFIGKGILSFSTKDGDTIRKFYSPIGGNYDSFACAVGDKYVYLLNDKLYAPLHEFDSNKDIIKQYYCYDCDCKKYKTTKLTMKTLYSPFYGYY